MCPASTKCASKTDFNSSAPVCVASKQVQKNLTCKIKHVQDETCTIAPSILHLSRVRSHKFSIAAMWNAHNKLSNVFELFCIHNVRLLPPGGFGTGCCRKSISRGKHLHHPPQISAPNRSLHSQNPSVGNSSTRIQNVSLYLKLKVPKQNQRSRETSAILSTPRSYTLLTHNYNIMQLDHHSC